jgi:2-methylcitrate dehydratase PrpD
MTDQHVMSAEAQRLMSRVTSVRQPVDPAVHAKGDQPNTVTIRLTDGRSFSRTVAYAKGDMRNPFSDAETWGKFTECTGAILSPVQARQAFDLLQKLETVDDVSGLATLLMA